ncbi:conserved unknown protein [Ectocarpus siliculosus]|uniref:JmjC domain-containing protein n=1 Tax=Ectocarpus siliculosus TaxID=2880 RepID=D8LHJ9_ECTSI|nr:conserved unknown protein [Ectocarpus siliculosus]|eukprot:CBN79281.1 conserved unknown protein [Ectocarpus siliculosus]
MEELFEQLQDDTRSFWQHPSSGVRRLDTMPPPADFFRDYVATSTPVILSGGGCFKGGGGRSCWDDLASLAGRDSEGLEVTVDFTPDGRGDCVVDVADSMLSELPTSDANAMHDSATGGRVAGAEGSRRSCGTGDAVNVGSAAAARTTAVFVKPEERRMKFEAFVSTLLTEAAARASDESSSTRGCTSGGAGKGVPYLSHQNDSLRQEFPGLMEDVEPFLALAREAFGNEPDAVNLWIGDDRSLSAVHKDHYENMYCVVRGEKHFTLLPPSDVLFLYEQEYPQGRYRQRRSVDGGEGEGRGGEFEVEMEEGKVPWIPVDPACPDLEKYPLFRFASPVHCRVGPGDILYLPSLWYHRVSQRGITVAVNYWHDMQFDHKYVHYRFLQTLAGKLREGVVRRPGGAGCDGSSGRPSESPEARVEQGVSVGGGEEERVEEDR